MTSLSTSGSCLTYAHWHFGTSPAFINVVHQKSTNDFQSRRTHISIMQSILQLKENLGQLFFGQFWKMPFKPTVSVSHHICMQSKWRVPMIQERVHLRTKICYQNCWARVNRKILNWPKMVPNVILTNLKLKNYEEYLKSWTYFTSKMTWFST